MSKGAGVTMRLALAAVRAADRPLESQEVARRVYGLQQLKDVTAAQSASVRRALRALAQRGEVEDMGRNWIRKRRKWGTAETAAAHRAFSAAFLAASAARRAGSALPMTGEGET